MVQQDRKEIGTEHVRERDHAPSELQGGFFLALDPS